MPDKPKRTVFTAIRGVAQPILDLGVPIDQLIAAVIAVAWLVVVLIASGFHPMVFVYAAGMMALPMAMIWLSDVVGDFTGFVNMHRVSPTSPDLIKILGWVILIALIGFQGYEAFLGDGPHGS